MSKSKILVVEDDPDILNLVAWHLKAADYHVLKAQDGTHALETALAEKPDLVILDLMLPGMDGLEVCKEIRRNGETAHVPIIMLTARGEEADRIVGLELGADDYVVKPFSPRELVLRVQAVLRRSSTLEEEKSHLQAEGITVDLEAHRVWVDGEETALTATEFNLLLELMSNRGRVLSRDRLLDRVWGYQFDGYARTVDTHIRRLRQKLGPRADAVETIRGVGYRLRES
ncbi:two component transcriptional regulator, winged helix family [Desulfacinum hydrothermale DSM 13146]|uniref:Phosphate regulon transcriptional regulatory protein PhoB n=1 Tax=Desulfacinum hydrothermale DSM 13146 TaxID=1121390 RepID=A0A1W1XSR4_9BACT|nr:response regulator transcription factor [Desulfacinum hydrothermale]SMC26591.1 two component transcriptional regulator, winged helix family [Desulfacinum hydrothermale DSM 13146]